MNSRGHYHISSDHCSTYLRQQVTTVVRTGQDGHSCVHALSGPLWENLISCLSTSSSQRTCTALPYARIIYSQLAFKVFFLLFAARHASTLCSKRVLFWFSPR
ncbi:hypothetical protein RRG08_048537 [Elysia crispata]|uniref:Uncharacterized protein n=1 Tax=Elysia crispata TaxID=231223 RepID=A0AAE1EBE7_9GAST|nr:hypothetical protein RRG08_048537 [Elysia crispata]